MKKIIVLLMVTALALAFSGCGSNDAGAGIGTSAGNTELSAGDESDAQSNEDDAGTDTQDQQAEPEFVLQECKFSLPYADGTIDCVLTKTPNPESFWGYDMTFTGTNNSSTGMGIHFNEVFVDGIQIKPSFLVEMEPGATMTKEITIRESVFQENGFTDITAMDASFVIYKIENIADSEITDAVNIVFQAVEE